MKIEILQRTSIDGKVVNAGDVIDSNEVKNGLYYLLNSKKAVVKTEKAEKATEKVETKKAVVKTEKTLKR